MGLYDREPTPPRAAAAPGPPEDDAALRMSLALVRAAPLPLLLL